MEWYGGNGQHAYEEVYRNLYVNYKDVIKRGTVQGRTHRSSMAYSTRTHMLPEGMCICKIKCKSQHMNKLH